MKLQQLRYIWEVARHDLNVSMTAQSLYTSQPGISKQIRMLEDELGVDIFARSGKHLTGVTPAGEEILVLVNQILRKVESIRQVAQEFNDDNKGCLSIATTPTQARYVLPAVIEDFIRAYPNVALHLHQPNVSKMSKMAAEGSVDLVIATDMMEAFDELVMMPCYRCHHTLIAPADHPLNQLTELTLSAISQFPILTYTEGCTDRVKVDEAFLAQGLTPEIVFTAADADVIKTYVKRGLGLGIVSSMASHELDENLVALEVSHLFASTVSSIGIRKGIFVRSYMYAFVQAFAPHLTRQVIDSAFNCVTRADRQALFATIDLPAY